MWFRQWRAFVERLGFELIFEEQIEGTWNYLRCWWRNGLLLVCNTTQSDRKVLSSCLGGNYAGPRHAAPGIVDRLWENGSPGSVGGAPLWQWSSSADGIGAKLAEMESQGQHLPVWRYHNSVQIITSKELDTAMEAIKTCQYSKESTKRLTQSRIDKFPEHVRQAICGSANWNAGENVRTVWL